MGKEIRPKREELEFLYSLFVKGYQDADILTKYLELEEDGKLTFPLRTDRRIIGKIRDEFETARSVLEPFLKQQIDPAFQKAREEHLASVRSNLEKWKATLSVKNIIQMYYNEYSSILNAFRDQKSALWFTSITEHLPRSEFDLLWEKYDQFEGTYKNYVEVHRKLGQQIIEEAKAIFDIKNQQENERLIFEADQNDRDSEQTKIWRRAQRVVPQIFDSFTIPFFYAIHEKSVGKETALSFGHSFHHYVSKSTMVLEDLNVNNFDLLVSENVSGENNSKYESMVRRYLNSTAVADLLGKFNLSRYLAASVKTTLDEILERRDYIHHNCRLCPASAKV